jgi:hypothetical protein
VEIVKKVCVRLVDHGTREGGVERITPDKVITGLGNRWLTHRILAVTRGEDRERYQ